MGNHAFQQGCPLLGLNFRGWPFEFREQLLEVRILAEALEIIVVQQGDRCVCSRA